MAALAEELARSAGDKTTKMTPEQKAKLIKNI
jgi:hypothetical protein